MMDEYGWTVFRTFMCEFKQEKVPDSSPRRSYRVDANARRYSSSFYPRKCPSIQPLAQSHEL